jgi:hypothetical protein
LTIATISESTPKPRSKERVGGATALVTFIFVLLYVAL